MQINIKGSRKEKKRVNIKPILVYTLLFVLTFLSSFALQLYLEGFFKEVVISNPLKEYTTYTISLPSDLSDGVKTQITSDLEKVEYNNVKRFKIQNNSQYSLDWEKGKGFYTTYVVPVSNFYTVDDDFSDKKKLYMDSSLPQGIQSQLKLLYSNISLTSNISKVLDSDGKNIVFIDANNIVSTYKLLKFNGKFFLDDMSGSLEFGLNLKEKNDFIQKILTKNINSEELKKLEYTLSDVTTLNQTGVTAITRGLAMKVDASGDFTYPSKNIATFLKGADLTHVSNEISSVAGCAPSETMRFCAKPEYLKTLTASGVDIVELTGNHNNDYGSSFNLNTIKSYDKLGMKYFGGGKDITDASKILYINSKGTKLAFIGYNYYDTMLGTGAIATKDHAGANSYSEDKMKKDIAEAKKNADIVIVDFQFQECYSYPPSDVIYPICYKPLSSPDQKGTFRLAIDDGADIVVGTQAHQPQTYEIYKGKTIFYGLGNLYFDQIEWIGTRQGLILTHYFKSGKHIQTKLTTTLYDNRMQTYITKGSDRTQFLNLLKEAR